MASRMRITGLVSLDGDKSLEAALRRIIAKDAKSAMKQGMRTALRDHVLPFAKANAQRQFEPHVAEQYGDQGRVHLKDTIRLQPVRASRRGNAGTFGYGVRTGTREELGIPSDAKGYYPVALEYGWVDRSGNRQPARPYMRPALWDHKDAVLRTFAKWTRIKLQKIFAKHGRRTR
jgi:hypothetical protein